MASKYLPGTSLRLKKEEHTHLTNLLVGKLFEFAPDSKLDASETLLWTINKGIINEWLTQAERITAKPKPSVEISLDLAQMLAFYNYWMPIELPPYEDLILKKVIAHLDRAFANQKFKKI